MTNFSMISTSNITIKVDGVKITISVDNLRMAGNKSKIAPIIGYIRTKTLRRHPKPD